MTKSRKQFIKGGDTHIINTLTGEEYYAPCEWGLLELLNGLAEENEQLKAKVKRLQDIATRTEAEKEEYADLYCKCKNEIIKNSRRCG